MEFSVIREGNTCRCIEGGEENLVQTFAHKVRIAENLNLSDFRSPHERGRIPTENDCEMICGYRGVSFDLWDTHSKDKVLEKYNLTLDVSRKLKDRICIIKFKKDAGLLKFTPNQTQHDEYHHDLYKADNFDLTKMEIIESVSLRPNVSN